jgi:Ca-activated chloride channel family protein
VRLRALGYSGGWSWWRGAARIVAVVTVVLSSGFVAAQYRGEVEVDAVVTPVTVRNGSGRIVTRVSRGKFHLFVDGMEVQIRDLSLESDLPLSLGFILDTSGSMTGQKLTASRDLITAFLAERRAEDQLALWTFGNERVLERFPFGMGWYLLPRVLETIKPWSTTALYDMIQRVPDVMERATHPRRAAILLTDGVDNASEISADDATHIAQGLQTPIYVLGVEPPPSNPGEKGPSYEEILTLISDSSGGLYRRVPRTQDMPQVARALLEELSSRFIVTFTTSGVGVRKWRTLEVKVDGHVAVARKGYVGTLP